MSSFPVISCIMPTSNRRRFVRQAIWYFQRQDYPQCELIIVDDGQDSVADLLPDDPRIRYIYLDERVSLGAKRNIACRMSQGEFIAHWDDDDWMSPHRLTIQVQALLSGGADICGLRELLYYRPMLGDAWLYRYPADARPWVAGGTMLYRRSVWDAQRFPDLDVGEDTSLVFRLPAHSIHVLEDLSFYVAVIHPGNTGAKNLADRHWQSYPLAEIYRILASDRAYYTDLFADHHTHELMR